MTRSAALAAAAALLVSSSAQAGARTTFRVGATVVASATVSAAVQSDARTGRILVQASIHHTPPPMLLVGGQVRSMSGGMSDLQVGSGATTVTVLY